MSRYSFVDTLIGEYVLCGRPRLPARWFRERLAENVRFLVMDADAFAWYERLLDRALERARIKEVVVKPQWYGNPVLVQVLLRDGLAALKDGTDYDALCALAMNPVALTALHEGLMEALDSPSGLKLHEDWQTIPE
jgi:hypothetical protein